MHPLGPLVRGTSAQSMRQRPRTGPSRFAPDDLTTCSRRRVTPYAAEHSRRAASPVPGGYPCAHVAEVCSGSRLLRRSAPRQPLAQAVRLQVQPVTDPGARRGPEPGPVLLGNGVPQGGGGIRLVQHSPVPRGALQWKLYTLLSGDTIQTKLYSPLAARTMRWAL